MARDPHVLSVPLRAYLEECEREHIVGVLNYCRWNRRRAARMLGIAYRTLLYKIDKYNLI